VFLQIKSDFSATQVNSLLGGIIKASKTKWVMFWLFLGVGVIFLALGLAFTLQSRKPKYQPVPA
jgi:hypothetical protein